MDVDAADGCTDGEESDKDEDDDGGSSGPFFCRPCFWRMRDRSTEEGDGMAMPAATCERLPHCSSIDHAVRPSKILLVET